MNASDDRPTPDRSDDLAWLYGTDGPPAQPAQPSQSGDRDPSPQPSAQRAPQAEPRLRPQGPVPSAYGRQQPSSARRQPTGPSTVPPSRRPSPEPPTSGRAVRTSRRRRRFGVGSVLVTLLVAYLVFLIATPAWFLGRGSTVEAFGSNRPADTPGQVVLLAGTDASGERTDSIMLLFIPTSGKPVLISLPRDSYVAIPGHNKNKINAAYAFGGPELLVRTVEQNTGLRVDHYLEIGLKAFPQLVDAVGGVDVCLDKPMVDKQSHANIPAGCQTLKGTDALAYSRMRKSDPMGDLGRAKRQREVISKVVSKAMSPSMLLPWKYWAFWDASTQLVSRDPDTNTVELARIALALRRTSGSGGIAMVVPVSNTNAQTAAGSSVLWDDAKAQALFAQLKKGSTAGVEQYA